MRRLGRENYETLLAEADVLVSMAQSNNPRLADSDCPVFGEYYNLF